MAVFNPTRTLHAPAISNPIGHIFAALSGWLDARATRVALSKLSDRELQDIGIARSDIDRIAAQR